MNKAAAREFAVTARRKLLASVQAQAALVGITEKGVAEPTNRGADYAVFPTGVGVETRLQGRQLKQRERLVARISQNGYAAVMEESAYTWFNRLVAVRFMEVNDYLPGRVRVLSSETPGKFEPDIVTQAPNIELKLSAAEHEHVIELKAQNRLDQLFRLLFVKQCNELGELLPELFHNTSDSERDFTELLLDISFTNPDGVVRDLLKLSEGDFREVDGENNSVEIIGWMYQYYSEERRNQVINIYKGTIAKADIPAATQLFTTDWVVRYIVDNSLGRYWLERNPESKLAQKLEYLLPGELTYANERIEPQDLKVLDPCMGSGHILVYAFEVLMAIYEERGYSPRDAASLILKHNLYGLDIDDRASQLAYFALLMRARKYNRRILTERVKLNLLAIQESDSLSGFAENAGRLRLDPKHVRTADYLLNTFRNAKEYGSLLQVVPQDFAGLYDYILTLKQEIPGDMFTAAWLAQVEQVLLPLCRQAEVMVGKYQVVVTNPPYLNKMQDKLKNFVNTHYKDYSGDLFSVFIFRNFGFCTPDGYSGFMAPFVWMFIKTYEKLREYVIKQKNISSLIQLEYSAYDEATVPICTFVLKNSKDNNLGTYLRLSDFTGGMEVQRQKTLQAIADPGCGYLYRINKDNFRKIPGMPIAYWVSTNLISNYEKGELLDSIAKPRQGMATCNNERFLRQWYEVVSTKLCFNCGSTDECKKRPEKWFPYNKGGDFRKWYGNNVTVVNWEDDGREVKEYARQLYNSVTRTIKNIQFYFMDGITYTFISSSKFGVRYSPSGYIFDVAGSTIFVSEKYKLYLLALMTSHVAKTYLDALNPTLNFQVGDIKNVPVLFEAARMHDVNNLSQTNISISKADWDNFEISWDFISHPLLRVQENSNKKLENSFLKWSSVTEDEFKRVKANEEELNRIFIEIYGLQDELIPEVEDKDVTVRKADLQRDIRSLISYAVGCIFGRYSLDVEGLAFAGGEWDISKYTSLTPTRSDVIPITDDEYFADDIVVRFCEFLRVAYGEDTLEENLAFVAKALGNKGATPREVIRSYFLKDFYKDHVKTYQKRPIYWLFDSGKENGFKALVYLHRYDRDTVGTLRVDYLHKAQVFIENAIAQCDAVISGEASPRDKAQAVKRKESLVKQLAETRLYDQALSHIAHQRIALDLDDGVKVNYAKFQGVKVASEGRKAQTIDLLTGI